MNIAIIILWRECQGIVGFFLKCFTVLVFPAMVDSHFVLGIKYLTLNTPGLAEEEGLGRFSSYPHPHNSDAVKNLIKMLGCVLSKLC